MTTKNIPGVWPLVGGIAIIGFGILLLTLRALIPSFILILVGISLVIYWIYFIQMKNKGIGSNYNKRCFCSICGHTEASACLEQECICCSIVKGDKVVGHSNNPLQ